MFFRSRSRNYGTRNIPSHVVSPSKLYIRGIIEAVATAIDALKFNCDFCNVFKISETSQDFVIRINFVIKW